MEQGKPFSTADGSLVDYAAICQRVRTALEPARAHAVSLLDQNGDVLWMSESSMGPDEHGAVLQAIDTFSKPGGPPVLVSDLGDSKSAVVLRAVNAQRAMVGAVMIIMDARVIRHDARGALKAMMPKLLRALTDFAAMRPDGEARPLGAAPAASRNSPETPAAKPPAPPSVMPKIDGLQSELRRSPIALHIQRLVPLAKGTRLKRYEVLLRSKSDTGLNAAPQAMLKAAVESGLGSMIDRRVITELIGHLVGHPEIWTSNEVMFSVNLTTTALHDEHFVKFVGLCLGKSPLPKGMIAFEIDSATAALEIAGTMAEFAASLHRLGCPLVLDDFALKSECIDLLRLPGVRYLKLAPDMTQKMRTDKLSQASITAVVQMARVLGMHTVAKRRDTPAEHEWLMALGVDFVQSNSMSPPAPIDSLSEAAG